MAKIFPDLDQQGVRSPSDVATDLLRQSIVNGTLEPGMRLKKRTSPASSG